VTTGISSRRSVPAAAAITAAGERVAASMEQAEPGTSEERHAGGIAHGWAEPQR